MPETCSDDHVVPRMGRRRGQQCIELCDRPMERICQQTGVLGGGGKSLFAFKRAPASCAQLRTPAPRLRSAHGPTAAPTRPAGGLGTPGREGWVCCTPGLIRFSAGTTPVPNRDGGVARSASPNDAHGGCHMSTDDNDSSRSLFLGSLYRPFCHRDGGILHPQPYPAPYHLDTSKP